MWFFILLSAVCLFTFSSVSADDKNNNAVQKKGVATYYASKFVGRHTSNGEIYRHEKLTAAHRTLPFGTEVTVFNPKNGKSVTVIVNDRGPFNKRFEIDLSQSAAREIGIYGKGIAPVQISYTLSESAD